MTETERKLPKQSNIVLNAIRDAARRNGSEREHARLSVTDIVEQTGIIRRRVFVALRDLQDRGLIEASRETTRYGHEPNTYTLLPVGKGRLEKTALLAERLGIPRKDAGIMLNKLWSVRDSAGSLSINQFCYCAGWDGEPTTFVSALIDTGLLQHGKIVW